eukprot:2423893-Rhodomonas_salina.1
MIVKEAFRTTGLYPLDPGKVEEKPGASTMGAWFSGEANADLVENPDAESTEWVGELQQEAILITLAGTNVEASKGAIICKAVLEFVMKQQSKQSAEYHKELQQLKAAKKIAAEVNRSNGTQVHRSTGNPSTLMGCYCTGDFIAQVEQADENRRLNERNSFIIIIMISAFSAGKRVLTSEHHSRCKPRIQIQEAAFSVQVVLGMQFLVFEFAVYAEPGKMNTM